MSSEHDDHEVRQDGVGHQGRDAGGDDDILVGGGPGGHPRDGSPRRRRLTVALVAAAVLAAAGGGAYWVAAGGGGKSPTARASTLPGKGGTAAGTLPGTGGGNYRLTGSLPADGPASAPLYRPDGGPDRAAVARLAALLGVTGPVVADSGSWRAGSADGTGPALLASQDAPGTWSYAANGAGTPSARQAEPPALPQVPPPAAGGSADSGSTSHRAEGSGAGTGADAGTPPVSEQQASAAAAPVLDALGLSGARVDATRTAASTRTVAADPVIGGLPTHGWDTTLDIGPDGRITAGHGLLSVPAKGESLPVISAEQAYRNLSSGRIMQPDHRMSCQVPMPGKGRAEPAQPADPGGNAAGPAVSPTVPGQDRTLPTSLPCVAPRMTPVDITGAEFGLAREFTPGGQALVPAWLFDARPQGAVRGSVIAQQAVEQSGLQGGGGTPGSSSPVSPASPAVAVSGYQADGGSLTLTFWGGVCDTYAGSAVESADQVRVTVTGTPEDPGAPCPALAKKQSTSVRLKAPLGARTVVDSSTGSPVRAS